MYYSEFLKVDNKDVVLLHDEDGKMHVGVTANEHEHTSYLTAADLRALAAMMEQYDD